MCPSCSSHWMKNWSERPQFNKFPAGRQPVLQRGLGTPCHPEALQLGAVPLTTAKGDRLVHPGPVLTHLLALLTGSEAEL